MNGAEVALDDQTMRVIRLGSGRLRSVRFLMNGRTIVAIEQNRNKPSRWGELAKKVTKVVQFSRLGDQEVSCCGVDGEVTEYGKVNRPSLRSRCGLQFSPNGSACCGSARWRRLSCHSSGSERCAASHSLAGSRASFDHRARLQHRFINLSGD